MKPGLYDDLVTENLIREIVDMKANRIVALFGRIETAQLPDYLTRLLAAQLAKAIRIYGPMMPRGKSSWRMPSSNRSRARAMILPSY